jgi:hypothetical protein
MHIMSKEIYYTLVTSTGRVIKLDDISQIIGVSFGIIAGISSISIP